MHFFPQVHDGEAMAFALCVARLGTLKDATSFPGLMFRNQELSLVISCSFAMKPA